MFSERLKFLAIGSLILVVFNLMCSRSHAQAENNSPSLYGSATVITNHIDKGLTHSDSGPALQLDLGYSFGSGKIGLWGSSVKFEAEDVQTNLRPYLGFRFDFTTNTKLHFQFAHDKYFKSAQRDGSIIGIDFETFGYHLLLQQDSNFEGSKETRMWYGFGKEFQIPWNLRLNTRVGYSQVNVTGLDPYFDTLIEVKHKWHQLEYALGNTFNSSAKQFNGRGDLAVYLYIRADF